MYLQLASFGDLDQISTIEKETNEYPWTLNNFKSSLDAGNSSIVLKDNKNILGYAFFSVIGTDSHLLNITCLLYTSPSPRDLSTSRMPSSA